MAGTSYGGALRTTLQSTAAAYGYTITSGTTIATLVNTHGTPGMGEIALFALGGLVAFTLLELAVIAMRPQDDPWQPRFAFAGALNVASVTVALAAAMGVAHAVDAGVAWMLAPMASTALYMMGVAAQLRLAGRPRGRARG